MKASIQSKEYITPQVRLIKLDKPSHAFLATSGDPSFGNATLDPINKTAGSWE